MEFLVGLALCVDAFFIYRHHAASVARESVRNVAYWLMDKHRLGHTYSKSGPMPFDEMSKWLTEGQLAKDTKRTLSDEEKRNVGLAASFASAEPVLNAVGLYAGTKEYWRAYRAIMDLMS